MKIELDVAENNEMTAYPWWMIVDPRQNFHTDTRGLTNVAFMITGPFFSREEAECVLKARRHNFGTGAKVWCSSGCDTLQYRKACEEAEKETKL